MANAYVIGLGIATLMYWFFNNITNRPKNFPPGPPRLPIWGSYWFILLANYNFLHIAFMRIAKLYKTKVIGFFAGSFPTIMIEDHNTIKEVLNRREFDGRPDILIARIRDPNQDLRGIFFTDGQFWHEQRRFALRYFRDFGFGRRSPALEKFMSEEINDLLNLLRNGPSERDENTICRDGLVLMPDLFFAAFMNSFMYVFTQQHWPRNKHHELIKVARGAMVFQRAGDDMGRALSQTPWLRHVMPEFSGYNKLREGNKCLYDFMKKCVQPIIESHKYGDERNFVDIYLNEMQRHENDDNIDNDESSFSVEQLILVGIDFLLPTITALTAQMSYLFLHLMYLPDVQEKVQEEIDREIGPLRLPNLDDKLNMPYTEACLKEVMRIETLVPMNIPHKTLSDTTLNGFDIPNNTMVLTNLWGMHHDKDIWGDPEVFRPERFLDSRGMLKKKDITLPFGAGKRLCAGETFARQGLFLMFAGLMQHYTFSPAPGLPVPSAENKLSGFVITPKDVWVKYSQRRY